MTTARDKSSLHGDAAALRGHPASAGSLYQFVSDMLAASGGACIRDQLLAAIRENPVLLERLEQSRGFGALLSNMKHSGFIELHGETVRRTPRRVGQRHS